jgi:hypothetical protein
MSLEETYIFHERRWPQGITMIDEEIKKLIDEQNSRLQQAFTRSDLQSALSALEKMDLDDSLKIDIGSDKPIFGKIVLSKEFGVIVDSGEGRYNLVPKEAIRSIHFIPKNEELQQLLEKQRTVGTYVARQGWRAGGQG